MARPSSFNPDTHEAVAVALYKRGFHDREVADELGIKLNTLYGWWQKYPEFKEKCLEAKELPNAKVVQKALEMCMGYDAIEKIYEPIIDKDLDKKPRTKGRPKKQEYKLVRAVKRHIDPNPQMVKYWLNNRMKDQWREAQYIDFNAKVDANVEVIEMTREERLKWLEEHGYTKKER